MYRNSQCVFIAMQICLILPGYKQLESREQSAIDVLVNNRGMLQKTRVFVIVFFIIGSH